MEKKTRIASDAEQEERDMYMKYMQKTRQTDKDCAEVVFGQVDTENGLCVVDNEVLDVGDDWVKGDDEEVDACNLHRWIFYCVRYFKSYLQK